MSGNQTRRVREDYIHVTIYDDLKKRFRVKCAQEDVNFSDIMRELISQWVDGRIVLQQPEQPTERELVKQDRDSFPLPGDAT